MKRQPDITMTCTTRYTCGVNNHPRPLVLAAALATIAFVAFVSSARAANPASTAQAASQPAAEATPAPATSTQPAPAPLDRARRGVVIVERAARPVGLGVVLADDGRILSALSALGDGSQLDARFADGSVVHVRVGHSDKARDLALLVPQAGRWDAGLAASHHTDPTRPGLKVWAFTHQARRARAAPAVIRERVDLTADSGEVLHGALRLSTAVATADIGTPIVDDQGRVMAVVARACVAPGATQQPRGKCQPVVYGAPMHALREFLRRAPADALAPSPWLGIQGVEGATAVARGVRVVQVHPASPAQQAGLRAGSTPDLIVAVEGSPVQNPEHLAALIRDRAVGQTLQLLLVREGKYVVVPVTLEQAPSARPKESGQTAR